MIPEGSFLGWFDDDSHKSLTDKVRDAAARYRERFGMAATLCLVSDEEEGAPVFVEGIRVRPVSYVRPNQVWIGRTGQVAVLEGYAARSRGSARRTMHRMRRPARARRGRTG